MMTAGASASLAVCLVGYESVQQFTCECRRIFGLPSLRDVEVAKGGLEGVA